ncbi:MAG TPA: GAF domain-containing protein [Actinomycetes bacterium]|jgi:GAF domain-containing protein|nr:GAF domain-containing protein [Actinomycetes bacterium]
MTPTPPLAGQPGSDAGMVAAVEALQPAARRRSRLRAYLVAEAGAVALGYTVAVLRDGAPATTGRWGLVVAGAVAVAVPLWIKSRRELRQEAETRSAETLAIETDAKLRLVVGDVITPIAEVVGRVHQVSGKGEREALRGQLKQLVVEAAASLCDGERSRATFFELQRGEMRAAAWFGRGDAPSTVFTDDPDDRRGQEALLLVRFHDYLLVDDVRAEELPRGAEPRPGAGYRSFISVSVFCGEQNLGMLSVDAPEPHAFDETDLNVMRAMAQLLGAGLVATR